jgi:recombination protein RecA
MSDENVSQEVLDSIRKDFGEGAIVLIGEAPHMEIEAVSTGSFGLDFAIGIGGVPVGRITEIFGKEASGKTTICQQIIANAQQEGKQCAYIDMEHALDLDYVRRTGVDIEKLYLSQPDSGEEALEILERLVRSHDFGVIVIDSVAALVPTKELEGDMGDAVMGLQARLMSQAMRKLVGAIRKSPTAVVFTNQIRHKIGVVWGSPETTPGGLALKHAASVRVKLQRADAIKVGAEVKGNIIKARVVKNKVGQPFKNAKFTIMYNEGVSKVSDLLEVGVDTGVIDRKGSFYTFGEEKIGQGKDTAKAYLRKHPKTANKIETEIVKMLGL